MTISFPHTFVDGVGNVASGAQVMDNLQTLAAAVELQGVATSATDVYQAGVIDLEDWLPATATVASGTGKITLTGFGGDAWLPGTVAALTRIFQAAASYTLTPASLPLAGAYRNIGIELTVSGSGATVSVVAGTEQATKQAALENPPAVTAGKLRIRDIVIKNTAGSYLLDVQRDRRRACTKSPQLNPATGAGFPAQACAGFHYLASASGANPVILPFPEAGARVSFSWLSGSTNSAELAFSAYAGTSTVHGQLFTPGAFKAGVNASFIASGGEWSLDSDGGGVGPGTLALGGYAEESLTEGQGTTGVIPSEARPSFVIVNTTNAMAAVAIGGKTIAVNAATRTMSFLVPAGARWKMTVTGGVVAVTLIL